MIDCESTSAVIVANGGDEPRAASAIKYTIAVNLSQGVGTFPNVVPALRPWVIDGIELDIKPAPVGSEHPAFYWPSQNRLSVYIEETPAMVVCESGSGSGGRDDRRNGGIVGDVPAGGGGGLAGGGSTPGGGGSSGGIGGGGVS